MSSTSERGSLELTTPLWQVRGIPRPVADALARLEVTNVGRLVAHLPMRHERLEPESVSSAIEPGTIASVRGEIVSTKISPRRIRPRIDAVIEDGHGSVEAVWFNASYLYDKLRPGVRVLLQGRSSVVDRAIRLTQPRVTFLRESDPEPPARVGRLRPVYPASADVTSRQIERAVDAVLDGALPLIEDHFPPAFLEPRGYPALAEAYRMMHRPASEADADRARNRLAYDELFLLQLGVALKRAHLRGSLRAPALRADETVDRHIRARLPFALTEGQNDAVRAIVADLSGTVPANRLIQGDVGAGKTVVALYAMLMAVASGHQCALMAPTELLAEQHFASISQMLSGSRVRLALLTGATPDPERVQILGGLAGGTLDLVVGTHALLTEDVKFKSLAVSVIDEQHRFGVHQRSIMRDKAAPGSNTAPHTLVMTATPIPRTLAITLFGDLDITPIRGLPPGRRPVRTRIIPEARRSDAYDFLRTRLDAGEQAFIVTPSIDDQGVEDLASVESVLASLASGALAGRRLASLHGRMRRPARDAVMDRFRAREIDAVVATTVVEVGVDIPNATVMVIEHADRFGLAQLHQLRGRVGRSDKPSHCILIGTPSTPEGLERLRTLVDVSDGFALAERDFEIRGPGEVFGTRQSGLPPFKVADLVRDRALLARARDDAAAWIAQSPTLDRPEEATLRRRLLKAHGAALGLGDVG